MNRDNRILLSLLLTVTVVICVQSALRLQSNRGLPPPESVVHSAFLVKKDDGLYRFGHDRPYTGWMIERYPDGTLKSRSQIVEGRLDGPSEGWYADGQLQVREHFARGVSHGLRLKWHPNGRPMSAARIVNGQLHGSFRRWHENGVLAEETLLQNGQPEGLSRAFYESGFLKAQAHLRKGKVVEKEFWPDGELRLAARSFSAN